MPASLAGPVDRHEEQAEGEAGPDGEQAAAAVAGARSPALAGTSLDTMVTAPSAMAMPATAAAGRPLAGSPARP